MFLMLLSESVHIHTYVIGSHYWTELGGAIGPNFLGRFSL